jgi:transposase
MAHAELGFAPKAGVMMVFRSKRGDRIKVLFWDGSGIVPLVHAGMHCRATDDLQAPGTGRLCLAKGWDGVMRLSRVQLEALFAGLDWRRIHAPRPTLPTRDRMTQIAL